jgi:hypothetical protein
MKSCGSFFIKKKTTITDPGPRNRISSQNPGSGSGSYAATTKCCKKVIDIFVAVQIPLGLREKIARCWILMGGGGGGGDWVRILKKSFWYHGAGSE